MELLSLCCDRLKAGGMLICFALHGANPITLAEALAQNFDHFNTLTAYTMRQVLAHSGYTGISIFGLNFYVYYGNPAKLVAMFGARLLSTLFHACFILYGKKNRIFTKKFAATALAPSISPPASQ